MNSQQGFTQQEAWVSRFASCQIRNAGLADAAKCGNFGLCEPSVLKVKND
jgi:hypothetical protein